MSDRSKSPKERLNAHRKLAAYFALTKTFLGQIECPVMEKNLHFSSLCVLFTDNFFRIVHLVALTNLAHF